MDQQHWLAYIVDEHNLRSTRTRRLFTTRDAAERHLEMVGTGDELAAVPGLDAVWCDSLGELDSEYAVLRNEPVLTQVGNLW